MLATLLCCGHRPPRILGKAAFSRDSGWRVDRNRTSGSLKTPAATICRDYLGDCPTGPGLGPDWYSELVTLLTS
jgi:hypothetical protein